jgi:DNA polymerase III epsilon subunit-like protein
MAGMTSTTSLVDRTWLTTWLTASKDDIGQWATAMPKDADGHGIDWEWVRSLDLEHGIGVATDMDADATADVSTGVDAGMVAETGDSVDAGMTAGMTAGGIHDALKADYATRDRLEPILAQCSSTFMADFDRLIASYRLPRALVYANRRLNDEINRLLDLGETRHLWVVSHERQGRATVVVLKPYAAAAGAAAAASATTAASAASQDSFNAETPVPASSISLDDIRDRTGEIVNARAERRKAQRLQKRASDSSMARANLSAVSAPGSTYAHADAHADNRSHEPAYAPHANAHGGAASSRAYQPKPDWRDAYLPGRDVDTVMGIDIETTGIDPVREYIIDVGFEFMNMASPRPGDSSASGAYAYEQEYYDAGDAYGQARLSFGVPEANAEHGNELIRRLTGIDVRQRSAADGHRLFDEWPEAQTGLLSRLTQQPYVAHNATFEHNYFMVNVAGYAEAYRAGHITIIDTLPMSRQWDPGAVPDEKHPYGDNALDSYAKRQGALDGAHAERHLGLEDAHIMLVAMKHHLAWLKEQNKGPWAASGRSGVGGKSCGRKW